MSSSLGKKKIVWFSNLGDMSSFSRVNYNMILLLLDYFDITILTLNRDITGNILELKSKGLKVVYSGSDTVNLKYDEYIKLWKSDGDRDINIECNLKYNLIQLSELSYEIEPDYVFISNGIYECNIIMKIINESNNNLTLRKILNEKSKIIIYSPIDFIPTYDSVKEIFMAHYFVTMTELMSKILLNLYEKNIEKYKHLNYKCNILFLGHGLYNIYINDILDKKELISYYNKNLNKKWTGPEINENDIIILNANNCVPRKNLNLTLMLFELVCDKLKLKNENIFNRLKLWIHTDLSKFLNLLKNNYGNYNKFKYKNKLILSNNNISNDDLNKVYKLCDFGLQTSNGEGFSLTNCEHALYNKIQFVPDFLATGANFSNNRGILLPVILNKLNFTETGDIIVGTVILDESSEIIINTLLDIYMLNINKYNNCGEYFKNFTWENVVKEFLKIFN